jgi:Family of unknown function (DUF5843)
MLKIGSRIELSEEDQRLCEELGYKRHSNNCKNNITDISYGPDSKVFKHINGIGGEFALARLLDVEPDMTIHVRSAKTDVGDLFLPDGRAIDVKTTRLKKGRLLAKRTKINRVSYFSLMIGTFPRFTYMGSIEADEFLKDYRLCDLGYGRCYMCDQRELKELI